MSTGTLSKRYWKEIVSILISLPILAPCYLILINSFKDEQNASEMNLALPQVWKIGANYLEVIREGKLLPAFGNTALVTIVSVVGLILLCSLSAFVIQRRNDAFCKFLHSFLIIGLVLPISVITTYIFMSKLHLTGNFIGVILLYIATNFAFTCYLYIGFFASVPREIDEAANIDGAEGFQMFRSVIFPILMPINATAFIINFMTIWNDFNLSLYFLNSPSRFTLSLTVYFFFGQHSAAWNLVFANLILVSLPVILVYIGLQKFIVSGMIAGAVKS